MVHKEEDGVLLCRFDSRAVRNQGRLGSLRSKDVRFVSKFAAQLVDERASPVGWRSEKMLGFSRSVGICMPVTEGRRC